MDHEPDTRIENPPSRAQSLRLLKAAVLRDLEWLLNTRRIVDAPDESMKEVNKSTYVYGLPDVSMLTMETIVDRNRLVRQIMTAINTFEPRLTNVRLSFANMADAAKQDVRIRIEAMLRMDPAPEPISFDTLIELKGGKCHLTGGGDAG